MVVTPDDAIQPSEDHPVCCESFDWHAAVHDHWCLVRQHHLLDDRQLIGETRRR
ncbi:DUF2891 family protein [Haloarcula sp. S1AR25-4]|uniref:DUF2891 family protein n=1 Tax=Haloarcula sp. S1AR25-4 TaxID=2950538 RepID=UPI0037C039A8